MKEVSKEEFYKSFEKKEGITTGCFPTYKEFIVSFRGNCIAKAIQDDNGEKYYITEE